LLAHPGVAANLGVTVVTASARTPERRRGLILGATMHETESSQPDSKLAREALIQRAREIDAASRKPNARTASLYGRIAALLERGIKEARAKHIVVQGLIDQARHTAAQECAAAPERFPYHVLTQLADTLETDFRNRMRVVVAARARPYGNWGTDDEIRLVEHMAQCKDAPQVLQRYLHALQRRTDFAGLDAEAIRQRARMLLRDLECATSGQD
jgi:hypothetical protein